MPYLPRRLRGVDAGVSRVDRWMRIAWPLAVLVVVARILEVTAQGDSDLVYFARVYQETGGVPGWDTPWSYPPLAGILLSPLEVLGVGYSREYFIFGISLASLALVSILVWRTRAPWWRASIAYFSTAATCLGVLFYFRFDSLTVAFSILGLVLLSRNRDAFAGIAFTIGGLLKSWPFLFSGLSGAVFGRWKALAATICLSALIAVASYLSGSHAWSWVTFAQDRALHAESFAALPALWARYFAVDSYSVDVVWYGAVVEGPYLPVLSICIAMCVAVTFLLVTIARWRALWSPSPHRVWSELRAAYLAFALGSLLIASPVLSPQFILWLAAPLTLAVGYGWLGREAILSLILMALSAGVYPYLYEQMILDAALFPLILLTLRDVLLVLFVVLAARRVLSCGEPKNTATDSGRVQARDSSSPLAD